MQVIVNEKVVDVSTPVFVKFQCADVAETKNVKVSHTNNLRCPANKNNNTIFENANTISHAGTAPYKKLECFLKGGSDLLMRGIGILEEGSNDGYSLQVFSGNKLPFDAMGEKTLQDLDLTDLNHLRDSAVISNSRFNDSGFIYAMVDFGGSVYPTLRTFEIERALPSVYVHDLVSRIEAATDSTFIGEIFETGTELNERYRKLIIPCLSIKADAGLLRAEANTSTQIIVTGFKIVDFNNVINDPQEALIPGGAIDYRNINFTFTIDTVFGPQIVNVNTSGWTYRAYYSGEYSFEIPITYAFDNLNDPTAAYAIAVYKGTAGNYTNVKNFGGNGNFNGTHTFNISNLKLVNGEDVFVVILNVNGSFTFYSASFKCTDVKNAESAAFGTLYDVGANLPKIKQKDLIKTVLAFFSGICDTDSFTNEMRVFSTEELEKNKGIAISIGTKSDDVEIVDEGEIISYRLDGYGQKTYYKYKEDDTVAEGYGDGYITINDETLPTEETQIELPFAATEMQERFNGDYLAPFINLIPPGTFGTVTPGSFNGLNKVEPRILILDRKDDVAVHYYAPTVGGAPFTTSLPFAYFHDPDKTFTLHFQVLLDLYYNVIKFSLNECKVTTKLLRWNEAQISKLRFDVPLYSKKDSQYFRLVEIEGYKEGAKCKTKMIKI